MFLQQNVYTALVSDWISTLKQSVGGNIHAQINAPDGGLLLTDNELVYINVSGIQRARLGEIAKVARENGELVISSTERPLIRGAIKADKEVLSNFFSQVRQVAAWARERRTVILESPSAVPMDSSFVGRTPDAPMQRPEIPDPVAQTPLAPQSRPTVTVSQSLGTELSPAARPEVGRSVPPPPPVGRSAPPLPAQETFQDRPRVSANAIRMSESRTEAVRLEYAGFWLRFLANLIDVIVLGIAGGIISNLFIGNSISSLTALSAQATLGDDRQVMSELSNVLPGFLIALVISSIAGAILNWLYYAFLESGERQGTLGKMALGIIVTNLDNQRLSFWQASWRYVAKSLVPFGITILSILSLIPAIGTVSQIIASGDQNTRGFDVLGGIFGTFITISSLGGLLLLIAYLMAAFTPKKQALHDMIAKTLVVKK